MTRDEMLVLTALNRLCVQAPAFTLAFPDSNLPVDDEYAFGFQLLDLATGVLRHARQRTEQLSGDRSDATEVDGRDLARWHEPSSPAGTG